MEYLAGLSQLMDPATRQRAEAMEAEYAALQLQREKMVRAWEEEREGLLTKWEASHAAWRGLDTPPTTALSPPLSVPGQPAPGVPLAPYGRLEGESTSDTAGWVAAMAGGKATDPTVEKLRVSLEEARKERFEARILSFGCSVPHIYCIHRRICLVCIPPSYYPKHVVFFSLTLALTPRWSGNSKQP